MDEIKEKVSINNYLDVLIDQEIDDKTNCPICISGVSSILIEVYTDLKKSIKEGEFQRFLKENSLFNIFNWKNEVYPIPINKLKKILMVWKKLCNKSEEEYINLYEKAYEQSTYFKAKRSPVNIKVVKSMDIKLAYLLGIIYADVALRNVWSTFDKEKRFRWEITITEELSENLETITSLLEEIFGIKTNVKSVYKGKWYRILFNSMILLRILNKVFEMPIGYKKGKLRMPKVIQKAPFRIKKYFVMGFMDGDGMCSKVNTTKKFTPVVSMSQSSREILQDLNEIMKEGSLNFNLYKKKRDKFNWYVLETKNKQQIREFYENFGFLYHNKKERLKRLVESF